MDLNKPSQNMGGISQPQVFQHNVQQSIAPGSQQGVSQSQGVRSGTACETQSEHKPNAFMAMWNKFYLDLNVDLWNNFFFFLFFGSFGVVSIVLNIIFLCGTRASVQRKAICKSLLLVVSVVIVLTIIFTFANACVTSCAANNALHSYYY